MAGEDRGGLRESVAEEELYLFIILFFVNFFGGFPFCHRATSYILYILRGVVD